jgi:hypothetical protein
MIVKRGKGSKLKIFPKNSRGQVTIFIIIAILIVALGVLVYLYFPKIFPGISNETNNPSAFIQECLEEEIEDNAKIISSQGGNYVVNSSSGYFYKKDLDNEGRYVRYLCYTDENFDVPCINQEPFLTEHIESEILNSIKEDIEDCFDSLEKSYDNKGYEVNLKRGNTEVSIIPNQISTDFNSTLTLTKGEEVETYRNFEIDINSNLYEIIQIAKNILVWEINVGDSWPEAYMYNNPYMRVEKHRKDNEVKIYVITDIDTGEDFRFSVRSKASPVGLV